jgi:PAS domain-containing protein
MTYVAGLVLLIAVIGFYLVRQLLQRQRMGSALAAKEAHFRLLAEQSSDMVTRIGLGNRLLYVSPSCARMIGWSPDQLLGTSAVAGVRVAFLAGLAGCCLSMISAQTLRVCREGKPLHTLR